MKVKDFCKDYSNCRLCIKSRQNGKLYDGMFKAIRNKDLLEKKVIDTYYCASLCGELVLITE